MDGFGQLVPTDDEQTLGVGPCQVLRRQRRRRSSAAQRQRFAVDQGDRRAGVAVEQQVAGLHSAGAARCGAGHHGDELHAQRIRRPGRHQQQRAVALQAVRVAQRRLGITGDEGLFERVGQVRPRQFGVDLLG